MTNERNIGTTALPATRLQSRREIPGPETRPTDPLASAEPDTGNLVSAMMSGSIRQFDPPARAGSRSSRGFIADRRRFERTDFETALQGTIGQAQVLVVNLSIGGVLVEHDVPLDTLNTSRLSFDWYEPIAVDTRIVRTQEIDGRFFSALEIAIPSGPLVRSLALRVSFARIARLESLVDASKLVNSAIEPDALIESILKVARTELGVDSGMAYFLDRRRHEIWTNMTAGGKTIEIRFPIGRGLAGYVAQTGETLMLENAYADSRFDPSVDLVSGFRTGSMLCVPVQHRAQGVVGVLQFLHDQHQSFSSEDRRFIEAISDYIAIAMLNAELVIDAMEKNRMDTELRLGRQIQRRLHPQPPDHCHGVDVAVSSVPCFEVGGDYHDFIDLPDGDLGLAIGDVSGKGVAAALIMSSAQAALRVAAPTEPDLAGLISRLDTLLYRTTPKEKFATFFFARYSRDSGMLRYVNAGHTPPLVCANGGVVRLEATGPPLGIISGAIFRETSVPFDTGSTLLLYTDGFTEAVNVAGKEFGAANWEALVRETAERSVPDISRLLTEAITRYEDGARPSDDKTLIVFRRIAVPEQATVPGPRTTKVSNNEGLSLPAPTGGAVAHFARGDEEPAGQEP